MDRETNVLRNSPMIRICCWIVVLVAPGGIAPVAGAEDLAEPELARAIAEKAWAMFDGIDDLQCRFRSTMRPGGTTGPEKLKRWDNGFYAYKRGGYEMLKYDETDGTQGPFTYRHVLTPEKVSGFREDGRSGSRVATVRAAEDLNFRLQWSPGHYLPLHFVQQKLRRYLSNGEYVVGLPKGDKGDPELVTPIRPPEQDKNAKQHSPPVYVLTMSREQGMSPVKLAWYRDQQKQNETILDLAEVVPGVWLAEHGTCRQLVAGRDVFAKGVESEFWLEPGSAKINAGLQVAFFNPEFPPGTRGMDQITKTGFTVGKGDTQRGADLKAVATRAEELAPAQPASSGAMAAVTGGWTSTDWLVAGLAMCVGSAIAVGFVWLINVSRVGRVKVIRRRVS